MSKVTRKTDGWTKWRDQTQAELEKLASISVKVGVLGTSDSMLLKIAAVHEYGATITPKNAKNLAIPLTPEMKDKSPRSIPDTWVYNNGENRFIVRSTGKDGMDFLFLLVPSVTIPERSYIRAGYDHNKDKIAAACQEAVERVIRGELSADQAAHNIGYRAAATIKEYMQTTAPAKSSLTLASAPGKTTPLVQSGRLRDAITYEVVTGT